MNERSKAEWAAFLSLFAGKDHSRNVRISPIIKNGNLTGVRIRRTLDERERGQGGGFVDAPSRS